MNLLSVIKRNLQKVFGFWLLDQADYLLEALSAVVNFTLFLKEILPSLYFLVCQALMLLFERE